MAQLVTCRLCNCVDPSLDPDIPPTEYQGWWTHLKNLSAWEEEAGTFLGLAANHAT